ncbi:MAG TPA: DUF2167 domain-containing protein, partial [Nannocystaceae bacterium]|nr:DUF2167 domain-containing protein [Nannocystaceae bacterium]
MSRALSTIALLFSLTLVPDARAGDPSAADATPGKTKTKRKKGKTAKAEAAPVEAAPVEAAAPTAKDEIAANPELAALVAELDPEIRANIEALSPDALAVLMEKMGSGEPLTDDEAEIAKGFQQSFVRTFERDLQYQRGDVSISDGLATLHLGDELRFLAAADAQKVLTEAWGNPPDSTVLGMIVPADTSPIDPDRGWGVVLTFAEDGYVEDDDAEDIDYDELLEEMQKGTEEANAGRRAQGYSALHLVGWAEPPHYDAEAHRLYWAQELASDDGPSHSLNYAIRVLGRRGVLELNAVAPMPMLSEIKPAMEQVMT